ncbi:MAG: hypothetical protein AAFO07_03110 [Bacteroidota bacterium]
MLSRTFEEWKNCITVDCKIKLTKDFIQKRLKVYENRKNPETRKFIELYGEDHLNNVIYWFKRAGEGQR